MKGAVQTMSAKCRAKFACAAHPSPSSLPANLRGLKSCGSSHQPAPSKMMTTRDGSHDTEETIVSGDIQLPTHTLNRIRPIDAPQTKCFYCTQDRQKVRPTERSSVFGTSWVVLRERGLE